MKLSRTVGLAGAVSLVAATVAALASDQRSGSGRPDRERASGRLNSA